MIPLRTDRPIRSPIVVNYLIIAANVLVAIVVSLMIRTDPDKAERFYNLFELHPTNPRVWQFITYQFLHDPSRLSHIGFNMLFLWVFGNSLEDRLGKIGYLAFYLAGGVFAGMTHSLISDGPVIGASGAISAVTGAYLALFPRSRVLVLWIFFIITWFQIPSLWFIGFSMARDLFGALGGRGSGVAYGAHIGGNLFGFVTGMTLLWLRLLPREPYDMLSLWKQARRRRQFRAATSAGSPWQGSGSIPAPLAADKPLTPEQLQLQQLRADIRKLFSNHQTEEAARKYEEILRFQSDTVLPEQEQLDVANQFFALGEYESAAKAYELYLQKYAKGSNGAEVKLLLGLIYGRYLGKTDMARELLAEAARQLPPGDRQDMARKILQEIT